MKTPLFVDALELFCFGMDRDVPAWKSPEVETEDSIVLHLGPGRKGGMPDTYDLEWPEYDFEEPDCLLRWGSNTVDAVIATHVLEHLQEPRNLIYEVDRVLRPGGAFNVVVPRAGSPLYYQDLDHKTPFVLETWKTLLDTSYYRKGKSNKVRLKVGFNAYMSIKEGNDVLVTQLIKE